MTRAETIADVNQQLAEVERCLDHVSANTKFGTVQDDDRALRELSSTLGRLNESLSSIMLNVDSARGQLLALIAPSVLPRAPIAKATPIIEALPNGIIAIGGKS